MAEENTTPENEEPKDDSLPNDGEAGSEESSSADASEGEPASTPALADEFDEEMEAEAVEGADLGNVVQISGMYNEWFLDYASYVILERAVPNLRDGLKPVQRRILHSLKELDDGRFHKVANVIGNTMKYHPHGDAAIGDALVQVGQKELMFDMQGNWGNILTGDRAAAARYIEVKLSKFGLEVAFNGKTTEWLASYDGRNKEPVTLPVKFPLLLAQGAEGIAVGLACKMLPHNFVELIDASIKVLKGVKPRIVPDFPTGGMADFTNYNDGLRGGKVKVRARIRQEDKKTLVIYELPFGHTTSGLIDSILKANDKGKIKVKKIEDNTAEHVEIFIHLPTGVSPDKTIDALYAFTDCEVSISPNACVIENDKPRFMGASEMLRESTEQTKRLLQMELQIRLAELQEQWHFASLEKIFIENRIYRDIEEEETWEGVMGAIDKGMHKFISTPGRPAKKKGLLQLHRDLTEDDITRLTEIRIKRISKFDSFKADEHIQKLTDTIGEVKHHLDNLTDYAIEYFKNLKKKYGEGRERKTEIKQFSTINAARVAVSNAKLYVNREEGFIGTNLKRSDSEYLCDCSDIDNIIVFFANGNMKVVKVASKLFVGKDIIHAGIWKKGDKRTVYNVVYQDGKGGASYMKRFSVTSITRDKEYPITAGTPGSNLWWFSANPNGEAEVLSVMLRPRPAVRKLRLEVDFSALGIKGRGARGNRLTKFLIKKVELKEKGLSTLGARKIWYDDTVNRLNDEGRGRLLGAFNPEDKILTVSDDGTYKLRGFGLSTQFEDGIVILEKWRPEQPLSAVYWDGDKKEHFVKRFLVESSQKQVFFIPETEDSRLDFVSSATFPMIEIGFRKKPGQDRKTDTINVHDFISVKGMKSRGNRLSNQPVTTVKALESLPEPAPPAPLEEDDEAIAEGQEPLATEATDVPPTKPIEPVPDEGPIEFDLDVTPDKGTGKAVREIDEDPDQLPLFDGDKP